MPPEEPACRRCGAPAAALVAVSELHGAAAREVAEVPLCGAHVCEVASACGFDPPRPGSVR